MTRFEILSTKARFGLEDSVTIEARGASAAGTLTLWRLGDLVASVDWDGTAPMALGRFPEGGYGVEFASGDALARTAVEVAADERARLRYGFVVDYSPGRDLGAVSDTVRRLHLTGVQFYDWAYRHADLLGGGEDYRDALGQPISLQTVRDLIHTVRSVGSRAMGYAAVYAAGPAEWDAWKHDAVLTATGEPYALGDFLFLVDPAAVDWLESFTGQLARAAKELGFDGFHLDQYGYPKRAVRADGEIIDIASSFSTLIDGVRAALPEAHLVFNNVNDFPTWVTARSPQDAVYIEVWPPQVTLDSLAWVVSRARSVAEGKPIVIAAYQHVYDSAAAPAADLATEFTMATLFSHGATHLLAGEADRILVDPYYVRNHVIEASTERMLARWYDFLVEHDELLVDPTIVDVTSAYAGQYNDDCDVSFGSFDVTETAVAGAVWRRVTAAGDRLVVHLINLTGQTDTLWDAARASAGSAGPGMLRFRRTGDGTPRVRVADPDASPRLLDVEVTLDGDFAVATLPDFAVWQLVVIEVAR
jgi:dextranase